MTGDENHVYGLIAEFVEPDAAVAAARRLRADGVRRFEVYSPLPIEEMNEFLARRPRNWLAVIMFVGALGGAIIGFGIQYDIAVIAYPINVGGRPLDSWPAFVPTAWEICALFAVYIGFIAFLAYCRLPQLYHPIFDARHFERATQDRVFLCVESGDPQYDATRLTTIFREYRAVNVAEVPL